MHGVMKMNDRQKQSRDVNSQASTSQSININAHTGQLKHMKDMHTSPLPLIAAVHHSPHKIKFMYTKTFTSQSSNISPVWGWYWVMGYLHSAQVPVHGVLRGLQATHTCTYRHTHTHTHNQAHMHVPTHTNRHAHQQPQQCKITIFITSRLLNLYLSYCFLDFSISHFSKAWKVLQWCGHHCAVGARERNVLRISWYSSYTWCHHVLTMCKCLCAGLRVAAKSWSKSLDVLLFCHYKCRLCMSLWVQF